MSNPQKKFNKRLLIGIFVIIISTIYLITLSMDAASAIYVTPSELLDSNVQPDDRIRLGGQVREGSIFRNRENKLELEFIVEEEDTQVPVKYNGSTPDIFGDNAIVFVEGYYYDDTNIFLADTLLTRHPDTMEPLSQEIINSDPNDSY
jgi:cytochrome c-type biogenesis protein CcmE